MVKKLKDMVGELLVEVELELEYWVYFYTHYRQFRQIKQQIILEGRNPQDIWWSRTQGFIYLPPYQHGLNLEDLIAVPANNDRNQHATPKHN